MPTHERSQLREISIILADIARIETKLLTLEIETRKLMLELSRSEHHEPLELLAKIQAARSSLASKRSAAVREHTVDL